MPLSTWESIANGLLAFLGLLVAALVQVIPITVGFSQPDCITPSESKRLGSALETQQRLWLVLLAISIVTVLTLVLGIAIAPRDGQVLPAGSLRARLAPWLSGCIAFMVWYSAVRTLSLIPGILSLQRLRNNLNYEAAKKHDMERNSVYTLQKLTPPTTSIVSERFGEILTSDDQEGVVSSSDH